MNQLTEIEIERGLIGRMLHNGEIDFDTALKMLMATVEDK